MKFPAHPSDETQRLRALRSLNVLDSPPEERFDRITRMACRMFNVPIALVSLVDADRQWFKSKQGLAASETPRNVSFCGHAILGSSAFIIGNALDDERFADNPLVLDSPGIRFYAGMPVHGAAGQPIGTLCILDSQPREAADVDVVLLADLAGIVEREFVLEAGATTDELTGLANRRGFLNGAANVLAACRRSNVSAAFVGIDLDNFKAVNDTYGHSVGDEVLSNFAELLELHFRESDVIARIGGDEFSILCGNMSAPQMSAALGRLELAFSASKLFSKYPTLRWSAGCAQFDPGSVADTVSLCREADKNMYRVKAAHRNSCRLPGLPRAVCA